MGQYMLWHGILLLYFYFFVVLVLFEHSFDLIKINVSITLLVNDNFFPSDVICHATLLWKNSKHFMFFSIVVTTNRVYIQSCSLVWIAHAVE